MSTSTQSSYPVEVCSEFLSYCPVNDIWGWCRAFKRGQEIAQDALRERYREVVRPFVDDPARFKTVLRVNEAVISGSVALQFAGGRSEWKPQDMDVYVPFGSFWNVVQYLVDQEGYIDPGPPPEIAGDNGDEVEEGYGSMEGVFQMVCLHKGDRRVDVLQSKSESALHPISFFWGTLVMNYLGADCFGCAYPELTFKRKCLIAPVARAYGVYASERVARCVEKYEDREYDVVFSRYGLDRNERKMTRIALKRSFEDQYAFRLNFSGSGSRRVTGRVVVSSQYENFWRLGGELGRLKYNGTSTTIDRRTGVVQADHV